MKKGKPRKFRSRLSEAIQETASDLHRVGLLDKASFRKLVQGQVKADPKFAEPLLREGVGGEI